MALQLVMLRVFHESVPALISNRLLDVDVTNVDSVGSGNIYL